MKQLLWSTAAAWVMALAPPVFAGPVPGVDVVALDESGHLSLNGLGVAVAGQMLADTGPGGLPAALTYTLRLPLGPALSQPVLGDVLVLDADGTVSDILRFNADFSMLLYSLIDAAGPAQAADTGLPTGLYANLARIAEGQLYVPRPGDPGYAINQATGLALAYDIASDVHSVPEPGSAALCLAGLAAAGLGSKRRQLA
jgi:PEP-CTERM motif